jgi:hypothetical protein
MLRFAWLASLLAAVPAAAADAPMFTATVNDGIKFELYIPEGVKVVRGVLVHSTHYAMKTDDRWADFCKEMQFAHAATAIDLKQNNRPLKLFNGLHAGLKEAAEKLHRPELLHAPLCGVGHSAGGMVSDVLLRTPERTLGYCVDCGWVVDSEKYPADAQAVPALFTMGAIPDGFKMLPSIDERFVPARKKGLPWTHTFDPLVASHRRGPPPRRCGSDERAGQTLADQTGRRLAGQPRQCEGNIRRSGLVEGLFQRTRGGDLVPQPSRGRYLARLADEGIARGIAGQGQRFFDRTRAV